MGMARLFEDYLVNFTNVGEEGEKPILQSIDEF